MILLLGKKMELSSIYFLKRHLLFLFSVRIRGCGQAKFKGFMIQPRSALYPDRPAFLGAFLRVRGTRYECVRTGVSVQRIFRITNKLGHSKYA